MTLRILNVICARNEIGYLPYVVSYYQSEGIDVYVIDNYSSDGTWEYLQDERIPSERLDTQQAFDLRPLQAARFRIYRELRPEWVIYGDADEFIVTPRPLRELIEGADAAGFNAIKLAKKEFFYTGEVRQARDPREQFFWFAPHELLPGVERVHKNADGARYRGDSVALPHKRSTSETGSIWNYGATKAREDRVETLARRRLAWQRGLPKSYGAHYLQHERQGFLWQQSELHDVRETADWQYYLAWQERAGRG